MGEQTCEKGEMSAIETGKQNNGGRPLGTDILDEFLEITGVSRVKLYPTEEGTNFQDRIKLRKTMELPTVEVRTLPEIIKVVLSITRKLAGYKVGYRMVIEEIRGTGDAALWTRLLANDSIKSVLDIGVNLLKDRNEIGLMAECWRDCAVGMNGNCTWQEFQERAQEMAVRMYLVYRKCKREYHDQLSLIGYLFGIMGETGQEIVRTEIRRCGSLHIRSFWELVESLEDSCFRKPEVRVHAVVDVPVKRDGGCYRCGIVGHLRKNCPAREVFCRDCNSTSHDTSVCRKLHINDPQAPLTRTVVERKAQGLSTTVMGPRNKGEFAAAAKTCVDKIVKPRPTRGYMGGDQETNEEMGEEEGINLIWSVAETMGNRISLKETPHVPKVKGVLKGKRGLQQTEIIVDTGATYSCIGETLANVLGGITATNIAVSGIGGSSEVLGQCQFTLELEGYELPVRALVLAGEVPVLLGIPELVKSEAMVDLVNGRVCWRKGNRVSIFLAKTEAASTLRQEIKDQVEQSRTKEYSVNPDLPSVGFEVNGTVRRQTPRPLSLTLQEKGKEIIARLLKQGRVRQASAAAWSAPGMFVPKVNGDWRLVIDYRELNRVVKDVHHPLPKISGILRSLASLKVFTKIDLRDAFWHVPLDEKCRAYTGFTLGDLGHWEWNVLPQGHKISAIEFQRVLEQLLEEERHRWRVYIYVDDILIGGESEIKCLEVSLAIVRKLNCLGFVLSPEKIEIGTRRVRFLGSIIEEGKVSADPERIEGLRRVKPPKDKTELRRFIGGVQFVANHIPFLQVNLRHLHHLTSPRVEWRWTTQEQEVFDTVLASLTNHISLTIPESGVVFELRTDASGIGMGAWLTQRSNVIAALSKAFSKEQERWSATERECYAIVWAVEVLSDILYGERVLVWTDHKALLALDTTNNGKLARWRQRLACYQLTFKYNKGEENVTADWLSRLPPDHDETLEKVTVPVFHVATEVCVNWEDVEKLGPEQPLEVIEKTETGWRHKRTGTLYIGDKYRASVLNLIHGSPHSGHSGFNRCWRLAQKWFYWPTMYTDLREHCRKCTICAMHRAPAKARGGTGHLSKAFFNEMVSLDFVVFGIGESQKTALIAIDHATRMMMGDFMTPATAERAISWFRLRWLPTFGAPNAILTDNMPFRPNITWKLIGTPHICTSTYYPQGNAINESSHRFLKHAMSCIPSSNLAFVLQISIEAHNCTPHEALGCSPMCALTGVEPRLYGWPMKSHISEKDRVEELSRAITFRLVYEAWLNRMEQKGITRFSTGDLVMYPLTPVEKTKFMHVSGLGGLQPNMSTPYRVLEMTKTDATLGPIWSDGPNLKKPIAVLKGLPNEIEMEQKKIWNELYIAKQRTKRGRDETENLEGANNP